MRKICVVVVVYLQFKTEMSYTLERVVSFGKISQITTQKGVFNKNNSMLHMAMSLGVAEG